MYGCILLYMGSSSRLASADDDDINVVVIVPAIYGNQVWHAQPPPTAHALY